MSRTPRKPGIGKSTTIEDLRKHTETTLRASNDQILYVNLNEYGDESRLIRDLFECNKFLNWKKGDYVLHLFIDSLDECQIMIRQVASILANRFNEVSTELHRLRLRIACRTADWPVTLEQAFPQMWGLDSFGVYELCPLRRKDVHIAAAAKKRDSDQFIKELIRTESVPLAIKPLTLEFLLRTFENNNVLPNTRIELYENGCKVLCGEWNPNRQDLRPVGGTGRLSVDQRLAAASRIAAVAIFCKKPVLFTGESIDLTNNDEITTITHLSGGEERIGNDSFIVEENHIREVIGTGLFSSRGTQRMGFAHQTYTEFLACRYLCLHGLQPSKTLSLLQQQVDSYKRISPQLYETAAWIACTNENILREIVHNDSQVLLRCDAVSLSEENRAVIVGALLEALDQRWENDRDWDLHRHYSKLKHEGLEEQLHAWISNKGRHFSARYAAIDIAEACELKNLGPVLSQLALDQTEAEGLRKNAIYAIAAIGDDKARQSLRSLLRPEPQEDTQEELKGSALRALWPRLISAKELFEYLTPPKQENLSGSYASFIYELSQNLKEEDLPYALKWMVKYSGPSRPKYRFNRLFDSIVGLAWNYMGNEDVFKPLVDVCVELFKDHRDLIKDRDIQLSQSTHFDDANKRRMLAIALLGVINDADKVWLILVHRWPRLIRDDDFEWSVQQLLSSVCTSTELLWAGLVWSLFRMAECSVHRIGLIFDARAKSPELTKLSNPFFAPVNLGSEQARIMKKQYYEIHKSQRQSKPKVLKWLPRDRITHYLQKFETGDLKAWWILLREMTLEDTSIDYDKLFEPDITTLPGWASSDEKTRSRILDGAEKYLLSLGACRTFPADY